MNNIKFLKEVGIKLNFSIIIINDALKYFDEFFKSQTHTYSTDVSDSALKSLLQGQ